MPDWGYYMLMQAILFEARLDRLLPVTPGIWNDNWIGQLFTKLLPSSWLLTPHTRGRQRLETCYWVDERGNFVVGVGHGEGERWQVSVWRIKEEEDAEIQLNQQAIIHATFSLTQVKNIAALLT